MTATPFPIWSKTRFTGALEELPHALLDVRGWFIIQAAKACTRHDAPPLHPRRLHAARARPRRRRHARPRRVAPPARPGPVCARDGEAHPGPDQRRAIGLRHLDGYPRDAAARLMDRSIEAVRCLERRAIRRMQAILVGASGSTASAVTA